MVSKKVIITDEKGLHMRPAKEISRIAAEYDSSVKVYHRGCEYNAKSLIGLLGAGIKCGTEIEIVCMGEDEETALDNIMNYLSE